MMNSIINALSYNEPKWMVDARGKAFEIFSNFPSEEFKESPTQKSYTPTDVDLSKITIDKREIVKIAYDQQDFVFADMKEVLKTHENIVKKYFMSAVKPNESKHVAFNYAFWNSGKFLYVPKNTNVKMSVHLVQGANSEACAYIMIVVDENSSLEFIEEVVSDNCKYHSMVVEVFLERGSTVNYYAIQSLDKNDFGFCTRKSIGKSESKINFVIGSFGGKTYVSNTKTIMIEEGAEGNVFEMFKTDDNQHMDITSDTHHKATRTFSKLIAKCIGRDKSNTVFRGMIYMDQIASQCISNLQHNALLLDETAKANAIPGLEIKTNDVQAKHGSAVGHIDQDHIFYLMSRGLTKKEAEKLIIDGYFEPIIEKIDRPGIQDKFRVLANA